MDDRGKVHSPRSITVVFTVDTEPDNQWADHRHTGTRNIQYLPRFQRLMDELGIVPTYLLTHSVACDRAAIETLQELRDAGRCEIGSHLHVWDNPPFLPGGEDRDYAAFAQDLPLEHFYAKLVQLTHRINDGLGMPTSYRAGRFGFVTDHIKVLESLGYLVDTSITPLFDRRQKIGIPISKGGKGGRDYRMAPLDPYHPAYQCDLQAGSASLLEVPLTAAPTRSGPSWLAMHRGAPSLVQRVLRKAGMSEVVSASPVHFSAEQMRAMLSTVLTTGRRVVNFTCHSSEVMPGGSPSIRTEEHLQAFLERIRSTITWFASQVKIRSAGISSLAIGAAPQPAAPALGGEI